jgi:predicted 3-demethylubiquinone-9 3-methyltransferase (glyoxalase superfamily)
MQKIRPFLWFDGNAEEAATFYVSIFKNSRIRSVSPMLVTFDLEGQQLMALNGGPMFTFTEAVSLYVACETQSEVDEFWAKLTKGGEPGRCGWLKDRFGLSWQIIPNALGEMLNDDDEEKSERVMQAMFKMSKLEIHKLEEAYNRA